MQINWKIPYKISNWNKPELEDKAPIKIGALVLCKHNSHYCEYGIVVGVVGQVGSEYQYMLHHWTMKHHGEFGSFLGLELEEATKENLRSSISYIRARYFGVP